MPKPITSSQLVPNAKQREAYDQITTTSALLPQAMAIIAAQNVDALNDTSVLARLANDLAEAVATEFVTRATKKLKDAGL